MDDTRKHIDNGKELACFVFFCPTSIHIHLRAHIVTVLTSTWGSSVGGGSGGNGGRSSEGAGGWTGGGAGVTPLPVESGGGPAGSGGAVEVVDGSGATVDGVCCAAICW